MKIFRLIYAAFLLVSISTLVGFVFSYRYSRAFIAMAASSEGKIIDLKYTTRPGDSTLGRYSPVIQFMTKNGRTIKVTSRIRSTTPSYRRGDKVTVLYDPGNPENAAIKSFTELYLIPMVLGLVGIVFFCFAAGMAGWDIIRNGKPAYYRRHGRLINASVKGITRAGYAVNGIRPWRIEADWLDISGKLFHYQSQNIYKDPAEQLRNSNTVNVYIKPSNPRRYWMDISFVNK